MISVEEAQARITAAFSPIDTETMDLGHLAARVLAEDVRARYDQPPFAASAMDGYAVRLSDGDQPRQVIGSVPAGHPFIGYVGPGEAVRIFTGGALPDGADAIVIQEDVRRDGDMIRFDPHAIRADYIRPAGLDFEKDAVLLEAGKRISARDMALLAAGDVTHAKVRRRPRVAIASIGDELSAPGAPRKPGGIAASTGYGLTAMITAWGGAPCDFGILPDTVQEIATIADAKAELVVTLGGASVGDHDLVQKALGSTDFALDFWKVAMRPGKPLLFGRLGNTPILGLPGNPVSALVCAILFLRPAIDAMLGTQQHTCSLSQKFKCGCHTSHARLKGELPANDSRQSYLRARLSHEGGEVWAEPYLAQDSSMLSVLAEADALLVRHPNAPEAKRGDLAEIIPLDGF
ncbi:molybdopterin molybdotransferase [Rhizomicrobium palustre]|uniref:Molybdopterin molybdenumtransferase n=1 Tax=Rhizomicrobium palustre TaxID=189966 RepID=A0A846N2T9_9PROT|nr:gephyrin-like molybdotransferase Glp [Rhizomicrobium palustre]NIK89611.1 molybdopterin molybdotransferase [Rhizomicrobium palustre]